MQIFCGMNDEAAAVFSTALANPELTVNMRLPSMLHVTGG